MLIDIDKVLQKAEKIKNKKLKFNEHEQTIDRPTYSTSAKHKPWYQGNDFSFGEYEQTKPESNWSQTGAKSGVKPETNLESNWSQTEVNDSSCEPAGSETGVKPEPELESQVESKRSQIEVKVKSNAVVYTSLVGLQKELILLIYNECNKSRSKVTNPLTIEFIFSLIRYKKSSVKAAIRRLEKKGYIKRYSFKNGRGGWSQYTIPDHLFHEILNLETSAKLESKWSQTGVKPGSQVGSQVESNPVVSSSYIINTTTTLPKEIKRIDYSPLADVGFNESHLIQIHREHMQKPEVSLSADIIQNSINDLAFDLKYNNVANNFKYSPTVVLTSLLKKGQPYSSKTPEKVLTPREAAMKEYLLAQEKKKQQTLEMENRLKDFTLEKWLDSLSEEELLDFNQEPRLEGIPEKIYQTSRRKKAIEFAKDYFNTVMWPKKRKEIVGIK